MYFYFLGVFFPLIAALLPVFIHKDSAKPRTLVVINWVIIATMFIFAISSAISIAKPVSAVLMNPVPPPFISSFVVQFFSFLGGFILSLIGFIMEIKDKRRRGQHIGNALWSTSFLAFLCMTILMGFIIFNVDNSQIWSKSL